jgi:hypothetical protein
VVGFGAAEVFYTSPSLLIVELQQSAHGGVVRQWMARRWWMKRQWETPVVVDAAGGFLLQFYACEL